MRALYPIIPTRTTTKMGPFMPEIFAVSTSLPGHSSLVWFWANHFGANAQNLSINMVLCSNANNEITLHCLYSRAKGSRLMKRKYEFNPFFRNIKVFSSRDCCQNTMGTIEQDIISKVWHFLIPLFCQILVQTLMGILGKNWHRNFVTQIAHVLR